MKSEFGKWLMDIAKYMTTAILFTALFNGAENWAWYYYVLFVTAILVTLFIGLSLTKEKENKNGSSNN